LWPALTRAANDNASLRTVPARTAAAFDPLLVDALRHFATHGLGAVDAALNEAEQALAAGDGAAQAHWLAITQLFDRRRAAAAKRRIAPA